MPCRSRPRTFRGEPGSRWYPVSDLLARWPSRSPTVRPLTSFFPPTGGSSLSLWRRNSLIRLPGGICLRALGAVFSQAPSGKFRRLTEAGGAAFFDPNPELAPYGRAAKQALESAGLGNELQSKVVIAETSASRWRWWIRATLMRRSHRCLWFPDGRRRAAVFSSFPAICLTRYNICLTRYNKRLGSSLVPAAIPRHERFSPTWPARMEGQFSKDTDLEPPSNYESVPLEANWPGAAPGCPEKHNRHAVTKPNAINTKSDPVNAA
jgi:hypothetical protein